MLTAQEIFRVLSEARLSAYRNSPTDTPLDILVRYFWNVDLCAAFYPLLQQLEVALRNALDRELVHSYGQNWFSGSSVLRTARQSEQVNKALDQAGANASHDDVVAQLSLGFWTSLLGDQHARRTDLQALWPRHLNRVFPSLNARGATNQLRGRDTVAARMNELREFRNKVFHHEAIWRGHVTGSGTWTLVHIRDNLREAISWISPDLERLVQAFDQVDSVAADAGVSKLGRLSVLLGVQAASP